MFESSSSPLRSYFSLYYRTLDHQLDKIDDNVLVISNEISMHSQDMKFLQGQIILRDPHVNIMGNVLKNNNDIQNSDCTIPFHIFLKCRNKICKIIINKASSLNVV